jgi:hypothetical protein
LATSALTPVILIPAEGGEEEPVPVDGPGRSADYTSPSRERPFAQHNGKFPSRTLRGYFNQSLAPRELPTNQGSWVQILPGAPLYYCNINGLKPAPLRAVLFRWGLWSGLSPRMIESSDTLFACFSSVTFSSVSNLDDLRDRVVRCPAWLCQRMSARVDSANAGLAQPHAEPCRPQRAAPSCVVKPLS